MDYILDVNGTTPITTDDSADLNSEITFWVSGQHIATPEYDKTFIEDPGVDGTIIKRGGYRSNKFSLDMVYTGPNKEELCSVVKYHKSYLVNRAINVQIGQDTYYGCEFEANSVEDTPRPMLANIEGDITLLFRIECSYSFTSRQITGS